jgi:NADH-quinone oxidoreductase subunit G
MDARAMLTAAVDGSLKVLHLIGVDPARDFEDPALARRALECVDTLIVQDLLPTASMRFADVVLPACAPQERVGSFTTWEGRRQPFGRAIPTQGLVQEDWDIIRQLARALDVDLGWETAMDVRREAAPLFDAEAPLAERLASLPAPAAAPATPSTAGTGELDGDLDAILLPTLLGQGDMLLGAKGLVATARPAFAHVHGSDARRLGLDDGAIVTVTGPGGEVALPVRVSGRVAAGTLVLPRDPQGYDTALLVGPTDAGAGGALRVGVAPFAAPADGEAEGG